MCEKSFMTRNEATKADWRRHHRILLTCDATRKRVAEATSQARPSKSIGRMCSPNYG